VSSLSFSCLIPFLSLLFMLIFSLFVRLGLPSSLPRAAAPGRLRASRRRRCAKGGSRRRSLHRALLRHRRLRVLRLPQGHLPSPCRWPQRLIAARGSSRLGGRRWTTCSRAGLAFWTPLLGPAGACRLHPEPEPEGLHRPRPEPEPAELRRLRPEPAPRQAWWCWMRARRGHLRRRRQLRRLGHLLRPERRRRRSRRGVSQPGGSRQGMSRRARRAPTRAHW
jgi:hypothetical protein